MRSSDWGRLDCAGVLQEKEMRSCRRENQVPTNSSLFKILTSRFDKHSVNNFTRGNFPLGKDGNTEKSKKKIKNKHENKESLKDNISC